MMRQGSSALQPDASFEEQRARAIANSLKVNAGKTDEDDPEIKQAILNSTIDWSVYSASAPATSFGKTVDLVHPDNDGGGKQPSLPYSLGGALSI